MGASPLCQEASLEVPVRSGMELRRVVWRQWGRAEAGEQPAPPFCSPGTAPTPGTYLPGGSTAVGRADAEAAFAKWSDWPLLLPRILS